MSPLPGLGVRAIWIPLSLTAGFRTPLSSVPSAEMIIRSVTCFHSPSLSS